MSIPPGSTRVLVIEDSSAIRSLLCAILREGGYNVVGEMSGGADFLPTLTRLQPDIVCMDMHLPDCDGLSLLRIAQESHPEIAVVMITGTADASIQGEAVAAGVSGFIKKPFSQAKILSELKQIDHASKLLQKASEVAPLPSKGFRVVVADDSSTMRQLLSVILESMGLTVVGKACDGKEAVDMAKQFHPHAICLDLEMPNMSGFEALTKIRTNHPYMPVVICTSHADRENVRNAVASGANGYILKPFQPQQVITTMSKLLVK